MSSGEKRYLGEVLPVAWAIRDLLAPACEQIEIVGSIRRQSPMVSDIELACLPRTFDGRNALHWLLDELLAAGTFKLAQLNDSGRTAWGERYRAVLFQGMKVDIFISDEYTYIPTGLIIRTGSANAMHYLMSQLQRRQAPFRFRDGALWFEDRKLRLTHESNFFGLIGMPFLSPAKRTLAEFKDWFVNHWGAWGDPRKFLPVEAKQMALFAGDYFTKRDDDEARAAAKPVAVPRYDWRSPWADEATVWMRSGYRDGQPHFIQVDMFSPAGEKQRGFLARQLHSGFYGSETLTLQKFLLAGKTHPFPDFVDIPPYLLEPLMDRKQTVKQTTAPDSILPTQQAADAWQTYEYMLTLNFRDRDNHLPYGVSFRGSEFVYLIDGHHRLMAARRYGLARFEVDVQALPVTLDELLHGSPAAENEPDYDFLAEVMAEAVDILKAAEYA